MDNGTCSSILRRRKATNTQRCAPATISATVSTRPSPGWLTGTSQVLSLEVESDWTCLQLPWRRHRFHAAAFRRALLAPQKAAGLVAKTTGRADVGCIAEISGLGDLNRRGLH